MDRAALGPGAHDLSGVDGGPDCSHTRSDIRAKTQGDGDQSTAEGLSLDAAEMLDDGTGR